MLLLGCVAAARLSGAEAVPPAGVVVRIWQSQDGLPSNVVRSVVQSRDGYLWVATAEGVARFDGFDFELIEPVGDYRRSRLMFSRLFATAGGGVWAATFQGGLFHVRDGRLHPVVGNLRDPRPPQVTQVVEDGAGAVFFVRGEETAAIGKDGAVTEVPLTAALRALFDEDSKRQAVGGRTFEAAASPELRDPAARVWSAVGGNELTITERSGAASVVEFPRYGRAFGIKEMLLDPEGNVWVASPLNGLARVRHGRVEVPEIGGEGNEQSFSALLEDRSGDWWFANRNSGLLRWTPTASRQYEFSKSRVFRPAAVLFEDRDSRLWIASRDGSVYLREGDEFLPQFAKTQLPSKVRAITQDAAGTLWFGGNQGLVALTDGQVRQYGKAEGIDELVVTAAQPFPGGRIIVGTETGEVLLGGRAGFATLAAPEITNHQWIAGILPLSATEVWVATLGSGLFLWNGKTWRGFGLNDGLPELRLTCVLADERNHLWLGSLSGIIRVARKELLDRVKLAESPVHWLRLDHSDGMPSRECIGCFQPAGWRARDGRLWFPTGGGIVRVRPELVGLNHAAPPIYLQSMRANGVVHSEIVGPLTTGPGRARLEFRFVGLSFSAPEKTTYRARLAGLDDAWRELGNQRVAAFEAVPPGRYTFEVMAVNGDGIRSAEPARVAVVVKPHLWQTAWFYLSAGALVLLGAVGIGWFGARSRLKARIQELKIRGVREAERSRIARDLHDDLGASLTEISMLSALAAEDAAATPLFPALEQLTTKAKHVVSSLDEIVWAVNPREDTLRSLVEYLAAFAGEFMDLARLPVRFEIAAEIPAYPLAAAQRHAVFLAAREALNNIAKHARATAVKLRVAVVASQLEIQLADNGRGFDPAEVSGGNGLGNLQSRMHEAGGTCRIESQPGQGTTVFLILPLQLSEKPVS
jgi:signal transduction histidine kinase